MIMFDLCAIFVDLIPSPQARIPFQTVTNPLKTKKPLQWLKVFHESSKGAVLQRKGIRGQLISMTSRAQ